VKLYVIGPGRKYEVYANANDPKRPRLYRVVGSGFTQKMVVYTDADFMSTWSRVDDAVKQVNGKDFFVFSIPPTTHYGDDGAAMVDTIEYDGRDVLVTTDDQLAEVLDKVRT